MNEIMEGAATPAQIAGFGVALRMKGETVAEVSGLAEAMLARATPLSIPGPLVDLVGTGGDGARTVNISTMGAIVAAAAGARVAKHGNRAASSACGAADVLEALGVVINLAPEATARLVAGGRDRVPVRAAVSPRAAAHRGAPAGTRGADRLQLPRAGGEPGQARRPGGGRGRSADGAVLAGVLAARGCSALVFHGDDGLDELTTADTSTVWVVHDGTVSQTVLDPADARAAPVPAGGPARRRTRRTTRRWPGRCWPARAGPGPRHGGAERGCGAGRRRGACPVPRPGRGCSSVPAPGQRRRWTPEPRRPCWTGGSRRASASPRRTPDTSAPGKGPGPLVARLGVTQSERGLEVVPE